jgi:cellulose synthase/poly-beta-1,6-N-acetylglucosamine synthase-like glycosyltransferase
VANTLEQIVYSVSALLVAVVSLYMIRHYIFSLTLLHKGKGQPHYGSHGLSYRPTVSILIPARDEEAVVGKLLNRISQLTYPKDKLEVILIDDASTDNTGRIADEFAATYSHFRVLHRSQDAGGKGKSSALNDGAKQSSGEILILFDADYLPQTDVVEKLAAYFIDPEIGIVQGRITVRNEPNTVVSRLVALERIGGYRINQLARDNLRLIPQCGGTVCAIRRVLIDYLGGWDENMLTEDTDLTFQAYEAGYKIRYAIEAECYEEAVENWRSYWKQRHRWAKGHMQCFFKHLLPFLKSNNIKLREKVDGLLALGLYFVPILIGLSWILGAVVFFLYPADWFYSIWTLMSIFMFSGAGNFASFFEVGAGVYLDRRARVSWIIPVLFASSALNVLMCSKALCDLAFSKVAGRKTHNWAKTVHVGGN